MGLQHPNRRHRWRWRSSTFCSQSYLVCKFRSHIGVIISYRGLKFSSSLAAMRVLVLALITAASAASGSPSQAVVQIKGYLVGLGVAGGGAFRVSIRTGKQRKQP